VHKLDETTGLERYRNVSSLNHHFTYTYLRCILIFYLFNFILFKYANNSLVYRTEIQYVGAILTFQ